MEVAASQQTRSDFEGAEQTLRILLNQNDKRTRASALCLLGQILVEVGRYREASDVFQSGLSESDRKMLSLPRRKLLLNLCNLKVLLAQYEEAKAIYKELCDGIEYDTIQVQAQLLYSKILFIQGDISEALQICDSCQEYFRKHEAQVSLNLASSLEQRSALLLYAGNFAEAEKSLKECLDIRRKLLDANHPSVGIALRHLGFVFLHQGKLVESKALLQHACDIFSRNFGNDSIELAQTFETLARMQHYAGNYRLERQLESSAKIILERLLGVEHPLTASADVQLSSILANSGDLRESERLSSAALNLQRLKCGALSPCVVQSLLTIAGIKIANSKFDEADSCVKEAFGAAKRSNHDRFVIFNGLIRLGQISAAQNNYRQADVYYHQALTLGSKLLPSESPDLLVVRRCLAEQKIQIGQYADASSDLSELLTRYESTGAVDVMQMKIDLAAAYTKLSKFFEAQSCLNEASKIGMEQLEFNDPKFAFLNFGFGYLNFEWQRLYASEEYFLKALKRQEELNNADPDIAKILYNLATICLSQHRIEESRNYLQRANQISQRTRQSDGLECALESSNLGLFAIVQEKPVQAITRFRETILHQTKLYGSEYSGFVNSYLGIGLAYQGAHKNKEALKWFEAAKRLSSHYFGDQHALSSACNFFIGQVELARGEVAVARKHLQEALKVQTKLFGNEALVVAYTLEVLANTYAGERQFEAARTLYQEALAIQSHINLIDGPDEVTLLLNLGSFEMNLNNAPSAENYLRRSVEIAKSNSMVSASLRAQSIKCLVSLLQNQNRNKEASELLRSIRTKLPIGLSPN